MCVIRKIKASKETRVILDTIIQVPVDLFRLDKRETTSQAVHNPIDTICNISGGAIPSKRVIESKAQPHLKHQILIRYRDADSLDNQEISIESEYSILSQNSQSLEHQENMRIENH